ncbi:MAG: precorrin-6A reductase [Coriobacteriaceae bacterium]|nr:precorrin-6A reductase [Coriobacteriaceae bacterium]
MRGSEAHTRRVLVFGGTSEGRRLVVWLAARGGCDVVASSLTEYGGSLVDGIAHVESRTGAMDAGQMADLMRTGGFACVVDATHPYAAQVSESIADAAASCGLPRYRILREGEPEGPWTGCDSAADAAAHVAACDGNVLLTTGSKDLEAFVRAMPDYRERLYARILPVETSLAVAAGLGIPAGHIVAMQGPFSQGMNEALLREFRIAVMVTKASGVAGGFWDKVASARAWCVEVVVIVLPVQVVGLSLDEVVEAVGRDWGV